MHTSGVFGILSTTGELCVYGVLLTAVSILSVFLLFGVFVFIRSLLKSGEKMELLGRSSAKNGSLLRLRCLRFLL